MSTEDTKMFFRSTFDLEAGKWKSRLGLTVDQIGPEECPYMLRIIGWLGPLGTLRLHKFMRSDTDRALHDHPWWFITVPLATYKEWVPVDQSRITGSFVHPDTRLLETVKGWRFHFRPADYRHAVVIDKPCWTIVLSGPRKRSWGFWLKDQFIHWRNWFSEIGPAPCQDPEEKK